MDPLMAFGLAGNIIQFVDFTGKLFLTTQRLYVSKSGTKAEHLELESLTQNIKELAERANPHSLSDTWNISTQEKTLADLGNQCIEVSNELLSVLESLKVRGKNGNRSWESFNQAIRSEWKKGEIELLQRRLDRISNQLNTRVLLDQQSKVFTQLHELARENQRLDAGRTLEIGRLRKDFQAFFKEIQYDLADESAKSKALTQICRAVEQGVKYSSEMSILDFLYFDTIDDRQAGVRKAHENTFSWLFQTSESASQGQNSSSFGEWLRSDHPLFWVTGKPGSGKSTLMKFICEHKDLATNLRRWSKDDQLVIACFFFWNAGRHALQKSQEGQLRSIFYQVLRQSPDMISYASPGLWKRLISGESRDPFTENLTTVQLLDTLQTISMHLNMSRARFCFFIDGLDEYEGNSNDIVRLIELLKSSPQVKMCISSRPWNEFEKAFGQDQSKKLYMQDLTKKDIRLYIRDTLEEDIGFQELKRRDNRSLDLVKDIVDAAQGVFLWVFLVVRSLLEGLTNADRIVDLQRRLRLLPTDLNEYFERILFTVDNFYMKETAQMFQITLKSLGPLSLIAYWFIDQDKSYLGNLEAGPVSQTTNDARLAQMRKRLNACCKGLLEVRLNSPLQFRSKAHRDFFYLEVDFLHRTVRDFLQNPTMQIMLETWAGEAFHANIAISEALLAQVKTAPKEKAYFIPNGPMHSILKLIFRHAEVLELSEASWSLEICLLDELQSAITVHKAEVKHIADLFLTSRPKHRCHRDEDYRNVKYLVLREAVQYGLQRYISKSLDQQPSLLPKLKGCLLFDALVPIYKGLSAHQIEMVALLLEKGCDPNAALGNETPWTLFLKLQIRSRILDNTSEHMVAITKNMLEHDADVNANCSLGEMMDQGSPGLVRLLGHGKETEPPNCFFGEMRERSAADIVKLLITDHEVRGLGNLLAQPSHILQVGKGTIPDTNRRKRFIKMIFKDKKGKIPH